MPCVYYRFCWNSNGQNGICGFTLGELSSSIFEQGIEQFWECERLHGWEIEHKTNKENFQGNNGRIENEPTENVWN